MKLDNEGEFIIKNIILLELYFKNNIIIKSDIIIITANIIMIANNIVNIANNSYI